MESIAKVVGIAILVVLGGLYLFIAVCVDEILPDILNAIGKFLQSRAFLIILGLLLSVCPFLALAFS